MERGIKNEDSRQTVIINQSVNQSVLRSIQQVVGHQQHSSSALVHVFFFDAMVYGDVL